MSVGHPKQEKIEKNMRSLCNALDAYLEDTYGEKYPLHPNRAQRGKAGSVSYDGLFSTGTKFTLGYGSKSGRGYLVDIEIVTLENVTHENRKKIEEDAVSFLKEQLPHHFPHRELDIIQEGNVFKIVGDFSLG
ncbi:MAG: hypothetical protein PF450_16235 [Bacteroidales bacterium]|jgi:hypothetical protein|nr:hypothetical protein [Bacteroidales bacterium]